MTTGEKISAITLLTSATIAIVVYWWNDKQKKKDRALDLFKSLMTGEFLVKARLISQEYLLEDPRSSKFSQFQGLNYEQLDIDLRQRDPEDREARFYIRAIPNFFQTVNLARKHGYILKNEKIFSEVYAWYWVNIMEARCANIIDVSDMFVGHRWMREEEHIKQARIECQNRRNRLSGNTASSTGAKQISPT